MKAGFTHYYKMRVYVDNGMERYETCKYVFADDADQAAKTILSHYNGQYDTICHIINMQVHPIKDVMVFENLLNT